MQDRRGRAQGRTAAPCRVGLISDTHGLLRPAALAFLRGSDHIIHAGDIGNAAILEELSTIAPLTVVRGNNDTGEWAASIKGTELVQMGGVTVLAIHDQRDVDLDLDRAGVGVVVFGHSHQPLVERRGGVLFVNPGSAGPRRFKLPVTAGELVIQGSTVEARTVDLSS